LNESLVIVCKWIAERIISQIRNARELVHLRRICERQNLKAQRATDAKHLDFGDIISYQRANENRDFTL
jgi:hypothetical protein